DGDFVALDINATVDGEAGPDATAEGLSHEVRSGQLIEGLDEAILEAEAGGSAEIAIELIAGEHAGKEAVVTATVGSVKERELPEADDEFAQLASPFDTIAELREDLADKVRQSARSTQAAAVRDKVIDQLVETVEFDVPESVVEA